MTHGRAVEWYATPTRMSTTPLLRFVLGSSCVTVHTSVRRLTGVSLLLSQLCTSSQVGRSLREACSSTWARCSGTRCLLVDSSLSLIRCTASLVPPHLTRLDCCLAPPYLSFPSVPFSQFSGGLIFVGPFCRCLVPLTLQLSLGLESLPCGCPFPWYAASQSLPRSRVDSW